MRAPTGDNMTLSKCFLFCCFFLLISLVLNSETTAGRITLRAGRLIDGRGNVVKNAVITIEGDKIVSVAESGRGAATYDLSSMTVLPGIVDTHVHFSWHFDKDTGKSHDPDKPAEIDHSLPYG